MRMSAEEMVVAQEAKLALRARDQAAAAEALRVKRKMQATRFARSFPDCEKEVRAKLIEFAAPVLSKIAPGNHVALAHVKAACENAYIDTMVKAEDEFRAAARGNGNRRQRRAAKVRGTPEHAEALKRASYPS